MEVIFRWWGYGQLRDDVLDILFCEALEIPLRLCFLVAIFYVFIFDLFIDGFIFGISRIDHWLPFCQENLWDYEDRLKERRGEKRGGGVPLTTKIYYHVISHKIAFVFFFFSFLYFLYFFSPFCLTSFSFQSNFL